MEKFEDKLKNIAFEPKNTSWLKLENRLQTDSYNVKPKRNYKLVFSSIAASMVLLVGVGFLISQYNNVDSLIASDEFAMINIETNSAMESIYNITDLRSLTTAYSTDKPVKVGF